MDFKEMEKAFIETELNKEEMEIPSDPNELAEAILKSFDKYATQPTLTSFSKAAEEETEKRQHEVGRAVWEDLGSAMYDWCKGAVAGAEEVGRAASVRGANLPAEYLDKEQSLEIPELTAEQQQAEDWYQKAVNTFNDETTQPLLVAAAFSGVPGLSQFGAMSMLPRVGEDWAENVEKEGVVSGTATTALNMLPVIGSYRQTQDPHFQRYAEEHPARAAGILLMNEAPWLAGAMQTVKAIRMSELTKKFQGDVKKAKEVLKAEEQVMKPKSTPKETLQASLRETEFKLEKPNNLQEEINMSVNPKVSEEIDKTFYDRAFQKEADNIEAERIYKGAYGTEIEATPPLDFSVETVTIPEIYETANRIVTTRIGNLVTPEGKALGHYRPKEKIVNVGGTLDLNTLSHEVGHHIDSVLEITGHDTELINAAKSRWGHAYDKQETSQPGTWRAEGVAEFTTEYVLNPDIARQNFPGYYAEFVKKITEHPELAKDFETLCQQVRLWKTMEPAERVRGNMAFAGDGKISTFRQKVTNVFETLKKQWIDDNAPFVNTIDSFSQKTGVVLLHSENPAELSAAVKNFAPARAEMFIGLTHSLGDDIAIGALEKVYNVPLKKVSLGTVYSKLKEIGAQANLKEYLSKHNYKDIHEAFASYTAALHSLEVLAKKEKEGITYKTFADKKALQDIVNNAPKEFKEASKILSDYTANLMDLQAHFGFITKEQAEYYKKTYPHYVPLHRDFSLDRAGKGVASGVKGKGFVNLKKPLETLSKEGSTRTVLDPITELITATNTLITAGERNKVGQAIAKLAKLKGAGELVVEAGENTKALKGIFSVWENGKKKNYQAIAPGLYEAVTGGNSAVSMAAVDAISKVLEKTATALRVGATSTPMFMLWNVVRDTFSASLYSKTGMLPVIGTLNGFFKRLDQRLMADFMAQGVPYGTFIGSNKDITRLLKKKVRGQTKTEKVIDKVTTPFKFFEKMNEATEQAPRIEEFKRMYDKLIQQGFTPQEALFTAGQQARDLTVNFSQAGTIGRSYNRYTAFFNAAVQGNYKLLKTLGEDTIRGFEILNDIRKGSIHPKNAVEQTIRDFKAGKLSFVEAVKKAPFGTTAWALTTITIPSIALWYLNHDKDWYREMPYHEKMTNWHLEILPGVIISLPKPELPGYMFGSVPERILDKMIDQDNYAVLNSTMGGFLFDSLTPNYIPTAVLPILEWATNYNFFRGKAIVPEYMDKYRKPEQQYNIFTSEMAKYVGQTLGLSPMKIDNTFRDVTGSLGSFFLMATDKLLKNKQLPDKDWKDLTRFTYNPTANGRHRAAEIFASGLEQLRRAGGDTIELKRMERADKDVKKLRRRAYQILGGTGKYKTLSSSERKTALEKVNAEIENIQIGAIRKNLRYTYIPGTTGKEEIKTEEKGAAKKWKRKKKASS